MGYFNSMNRHQNPNQEKCHPSSGTHIVTDHFLKHFEGFFFP